MGQKDPTVDMFSLLLVEFQRSEAAAEERREKNEAAAELRRWKAEADAEQLRKEEAEHRLKAEERAQHIKLLEMLHEGKISKEMYEVMKPSGF
jgi:Asp-tRNA(Asn)/Glu-tRNA(Gln) amidotransferase B subunit